MITLEYASFVMGLLAAGVAVVNFRDASNPKRCTNAMFWRLYALTFLAGTYLPHVATGCIVITMVLVASVASSDKVQARARRSRIAKPARHARATGCSFPH